MAKLYEFTEDQSKAWQEWVATRPPVIQKMCERLAPNRLYRLNSSGHRVTVYSFSEDGTVTVDVSGKYNALFCDRRVFGIKPEDLEECGLPGPEECIGYIPVRLETPLDGWLTRRAARNE